MKKSLIALAVLAASGAAMAQSSVTLFGIVDAAYQRVDGDGNGNINRLVSGSNATSRLGFRGVEDLGGGLKASFHLEGALAVDDGTSTGFNFQRRSTVSVHGNFGEVRLGRDYTPLFNNLVAYDVFGTVGVGNSNNLNLTKGVFGVVSATGIRTSNAISYLLPSNLGGFYGQATYAFGEQASNVAAPAHKNDGNLFGLRAGYANGPLNVSFAYGDVKLKAAGDYTTYNLGASYDLNVVKLFANYGREELGTIATRGKAKNDSYILGLTAPVGPGTIKASYVHVNQNNIAGNNDAGLLAVGYVYDLSKRTAVYGTYARVDNKSGSTLYNNGRATTEAGGNTNGLEVGVRHSF
ncbi:MAG: porin [Burkholderiaceae bacterium]|nr:porin [Burkholderiaceae bacterium]